jgi:hypothetical protein
MVKRLNSEVEGLLQGLKQGVGGRSPSSVAPLPALEEVFVAVGRL